MIRESFFFLDRNVDILCGIKDFAALLTLNKFDIVLAGDNFDDGMFAGGSHWFGECEWYGFCPSSMTLSTPFYKAFS
jgi:hypothetical protein